MSNAGRKRKLTESQQQDIKQSKLNIKQLAAVYGVGIMTIYRVYNKPKAA